MNIRGAITAIIVLGISASVPAVAQEAAAVYEPSKTREPAQNLSQDHFEMMQQTTLGLIRKLVDKGVLTKEAADQLIKEAEQAAEKAVASRLTAPVEVPLQPGVTRVPYVPEFVRRDMKEEIKREVLAQARGERWGDPGALPGWVGKISWSGDIRLRFQRDSFPDGNSLPGAYNPAGLPLISNTTETHSYTRLQARLGMKAKVSDYTFADFRLSTGSTTNPVSTNQTLGNGYNKHALMLDQAYLQSNPYSWLTLSGGKMPNPWLSTELVWDLDVNFEGFALNFKPRFNDEWSGFITTGAFPYQNIQRSDIVLANSKWLYGAQLGATWFGPDTSNGQFGVALYYFDHIEGTPNPIKGTFNYDFTSALSLQKGNTLMYVNATGDTTLYGIASKFTELNITAKYDWATFDPTHILIAADYVRNLGYDQSEITQRTKLPAPDPKVTGYKVALTIGAPNIKQRGDWQASIAYKYLEADAVLDSLTDSNLHLGGTNTKGFIIGGRYGVDKNTWLSLGWFSSDQIEGQTLAIDTLQLDLSTRF